MVSVVSVVLGKRIALRTYMHVSAIYEASEEYQHALTEAEIFSGLLRKVDFNVIRFELALNRIALLNYPTFFDEAFPALQESWNIDLNASEHSRRTYTDSLNPPILHRKELLLSVSHPHRAEFEALTRSAEDIGLFDDSSRIGYQRQWQHLVRESGYQVVDHQLIPYGNDECGEEDTQLLHEGWQASRQLTALVRYGFSAPFQTLARHGFLDGRYKVFDYGCGRGDDLRGLLENGLEVGGWDPFYAADNSIHSADLVNLGFVINVIEDFDERVEALARAFSLAERLLVVSVMLRNNNSSAGKMFSDGVMTKRGTFQKYYTQGEIKDFIGAVTDEEPIPVAPGVFYLFRDKNLEQRFLVGRYRRRRNRLRDPSVHQKELEDRRSGRAAEKYEKFREPLEMLWTTWLTLGRKPHETEVENISPLLDGFGSLARALRFLRDQNGADLLESAQASRIEDLEVYLALNLFERRKPYKHMEKSLQRDIKFFFGTITQAQEVARELLFQIADVQTIEAACITAVERGLGFYLPGESLKLHSSLIDQLPSILRVYVGCAVVLYGDYRNADLVKIHVTSGKVSLMRYDDFEGKALPRMVERTKIKLREQDIDYFAYGEEFEPPFLYQKSRYINEEFSNYPEQVVFEETLESLGIFDLSGYGPAPAEFQDMLTKHRWAVEGFKLVRSSMIPDPGSRCGQYLDFRQLIACGETRAKIGFANLPKQPESYNALFDLATNVLDPVIDYFGMIHLTYGFCSSELAKEILGRINPGRDQHAAHELNQRGKPICERLGAAVDFLVEDECMLEVAQWIAVNTPFDRLYFYGADKPVHVSFGPNHDKQIVRMILSKSGRLMPRVISSEAFLKLS
ncbi:MAG: DNA phosphorothioation-associated putative methyltransferase [Gammaproteobacteria bacterium]|nr:DNA phosphorothioation-associated putative methyltransferase [Gammaproteobacteria bacterium]